MFPRGCSFIDWSAPDRPERDRIRYGEPALRHKCLIRRKCFGLEEAIRVVHVDPGDDRVAASFCDMKKLRRRVRTVRPQAQQIQFQRNVPFLCGQTQPFHFPPVERFGAGKLNQIRVRQIGIQPGIQSCNALVYINFQNLRIIRWLIDINTIDLVVDIVLTEQQIVDGILRDARKQIVKKPGIILRLVANQNLDAAGVFCLERQKRLDIVV